MTGSEDSDPDRLGAPRLLRAVGMAAMMLGLLAAHRMGLAQASRPMTLPAAEAQKLVDQAMAFYKDLADTDTAPTPQQQAKAVGACQAFDAAYQHLGVLGGQTGALGKMGMRAGWTAGDPEVMIRGARMMLNQGLVRYGGFALAWAGVYAGNPAAAREALARLIQEPGSDDFGRQLAGWAKGEMTALASQCGTKLDLSFTRLDGQTVKLAGLRGKAVVLDFWAKNEFYIKELPGLKEFHKQRSADTNFLMFGLSGESGADAAGRAARQLGLAWPQAMHSRLRGRFAGQGTPHIVVISPLGHVLWQGHPANNQSLVRTTDFALRHAALLAARAPATAPAATSSAPATTFP